MNLYLILTFFKLVQARNPSFCAEAWSQLAHFEPFVLQIFEFYSRAQLLVGKTASFETIQV